MLLYRPVFRNQEKAARPSNLAEAEALAPGVTPVYPDRVDLMVDVETPQGEKVAIDDSQLIEMLRKGIRDSHQLTLLRSDRAMTDCRPVSIFSIQTVRQLGQEVGTDLDKRRFRANVYADFGSAHGFSEDELVGRTLRDWR